MIKLLFNPFEKYSEKTLVTFGIITTIIGILLGLVFNGIYDGILDMHPVKDISISEIIYSLFTNFLIIGIILFVLGKFINPKTRLIDVLSTILSAKIPLYLLTITNINGFNYNLGLEIQSKFIQNQMNNFSVLLLSKLILITILSLIVMVWTISLLYNGFKTATNLKSKKHILLFIFSLIIAEVISKMVISYFL